MNELLYTLGLICERRGFDLKQVRRMAFSMPVNFGLASGTALLPIVANTFYYLKTLCVHTVTTQVTAAVLLEITDLGGGSPATNYIRTHMTQYEVQTFHGLETDKLLYVVNGNTAGGLLIEGDVYKITYA